MKNPLPHNHDFGPVKKDDFILFSSFFFAKKLYNLVSNCVLTAILELLTVCSPRIIPQTMDAWYCLLGRLAVKVVRYFGIKFRVFKKATQFDTIFHLIWRFSKCQIKWKIVSNSCGLFRMSELYCQHIFFHCASLVHQFVLISRFFYKKLSFSYSLQKYLFTFGLWVLAVKNFEFRHCASVARGLASVFFLIVFGVKVC